MYAGPARAAAAVNQCDVCAAYRTVSGKIPCTRASVSVNDREPVSFTVVDHLQSLSNDYFRLTPLWGVRLDYGVSSLAGLCVE